ncbi:MAG: hypothetical protein AABX17_01305 [Nanoarchaeota archaeon]
MNEGIKAKHLTEKEKFIKFERMSSYVIPAGGKHQIVHNDGQEDIGIAVSNNGRQDFRQFNESKVYWFTQPYAYVVSSPMKSQGIVIDLSHLV